MTVGSLPLRSAPNMEFLRLITGMDVDRQRSGGYWNRRWRREDRSSFAFRAREVEGGVHWRTSSHSVHSREGSGDERVTMKVGPGAERWGTEPPRAGRRVRLFHQPRSSRTRLQVTWTRTRTPGLYRYPPGWWIPARVGVPGNLEFYGNASCALLEWSTAAGPSSPVSYVIWIFGFSAP